MTWVPSFSWGNCSLSGQPPTPAGEAEVDITFQASHSQLHAACCPSERVSLHIHAGSRFGRRWNNCALVLEFPSTSGPSGIFASPAAPPESSGPGAPRIAGRPSGAAGARVLFSVQPECPGLGPRGLHRRQPPGDSEPLPHPGPIAEKGPR